MRQLQNDPEKIRFFYQEPWLGDKLDLLLAESLRVAHDAGALRTQDLTRVTADTTVQPLPPTLTRPLPQWRAPGQHMTRSVLSTESLLALR